MWSFLFTNPLPYRQGAKRQLRFLCTWVLRWRRERLSTIRGVTSAVFCPTCLPKEDIAADPLHFSKIAFQMLCRSLLLTYQALCQHFVSCTGIVSFSSLDSL